MASEQNVHVDIVFDARPALRALRRLRRKLWWMKWGPLMAFIAIGTVGGTIAGTVVSLAGHAWGWW